ncbi:MAG: DUF4266 domain-containing protein [Nitrospirae bacterium]|nr:DUF4266 domain-containing protein [Nitrospirota bacterium]MBF0535570.1 DUF4266 domain-containing protein [Nitrospirota bacterium]MBF0617403.1 DUF4266 domain-containing protein [Nitrospirota bacterium]
MKLITLAIVIIAVAFLSSCSEKLAIVKPYEREFLAEDRMFFSPMEGRSELEGHVFLIREAAEGGEGTFQGGCGCR